MRYLIIGLILVVAEYAGANELLSEDFEQAEAHEALKMPAGPESLLLLDQEQDKRVSRGDSGKETGRSLRLHEHPERDREAQIGVGYRPAAELTLADHEPPETIVVSFDFKQMSGDTTGLDVDLLDLSKSYGSWIRLTLGLDEIKLMRGKTHPAPQLTNGPESEWHHVVMTLPYPGVKKEEMVVTIQVDDEVVVSDAAFGAFGKPEKLSHLRFSNGGLGPDFYYLDNVKVEAK